MAELFKREWNDKIKVWAEHKREVESVEGRETQDKQYAWVIWREGYEACEYKRGSDA